MRLEVADEANPGEKASPTGIAEVGRRCAVGADGSGLACCTLLLSLKGPMLLCCAGSFCDEVVPVGSVRGKPFSGLSADVEVF